MAVDLIPVYRSAEMGRRRGPGRAPLHMIRPDLPARVSLGGGRALSRATTHSVFSSGRGFAVRDDVGPRTAAADVVVGAGWEGWRIGVRVVTVDEVIARAAADVVAAEVAEQGVVIRPTGDYVIERAAERQVLTRTGVDRVHATKADELVGAHSAVHRVVAAQAGQEVTTLPAVERVVVRPVGGGRRIAGEFVPDELVVALTAVKDVVAALTAHDVVAAPGIHHIVSPAGHDDVVAIRAVDDAGAHNGGRGPLHLA